MALQLCARRTGILQAIRARATPRRDFSSSVGLRVTYGFIGLGAMGLPMARNLRARVDKRDRLAVFDVNTEAIEAFCSGLENSENTHAASSEAEAASAAVVISVLPEPQHVREVYDNILTAKPLEGAGLEPRLFIDCSTIDPSTSRAIAAEVDKKTERTTAFVDAPMSGGVVGARAGTLTFMLGAAPEHVTSATATLSLMGTRVVHLGPQGAGLCGKLANNYLLALNNIATAEAMSMGQRWGLDGKALADMINTSTGRNWPSEVNNPVPGVVPNAPAGRGYEGGFGISLMRKDLRLALESAKEFEVKVGLGHHAMRMYDEAVQDERCKGKDFSSIYRWLDGPVNVHD